MDWSMIHMNSFDAALPWSALMYSTVSGERFLSWENGIQIEILLPSTSPHAHNFELANDILWLCIFFCYRRRAFIDHSWEFYHSHVLFIQPKANSILIGFHELSSDWWYRSVFFIVLIRNHCYHSWNIYISFIFQRHN